MVDSHRGSLDGLPVMVMMGIMWGILLVWMFSVSMASDYNRPTAKAQSIEVKDKWGARAVYFHAYPGSTRGNIYLGVVYIWDHGASGEPEFMRIRNIYGKAVMDRTKYTSDLDPEAEYAKWVSRWKESTNHI